MNVSLNWLKSYIDLDFTPEKIGEMLTDIGLEVEGLEEVESIPGGLKGVVVGHVLESGKHPNADKLSLNKVDIGGAEPLQIVCGAPNVAAGQKVMVATVGTTLPLETEKGLLKIKKGKIRGETSAGMICAEDELGIGQDHDGIIVLPAETKIGTPASEYFNIESDFVYEIGLTPNRSDATNHIGVARDLAAYLRINHDYEGTINLPSVEDFSVESTDFPVDIEVEDPILCPRYAGLTIKDIEIKESPEWLKNRLTSIGVKTINNIVDITNFILHEFGQPLHAFDLDAIKGKKIIVKTLPEGTPFITLDEVERKLSGEDLMICDGDSAGMCIGGVFGGIKSGVSDSTTSIFLESAHFNAKSIRRSSMRHNLRTDAAKVFEKGSDPNIAVYALKRAVQLIKELAGGKVSSELYDLYPNPIERNQVDIRYNQINRLIGEDIPTDTIKNILDALDMEILAESNEQLTINIPTNKTDVLREVDVIEEILRIYGFNKVPIPKYIHTAISVAEYPNKGDVQNSITDMLTANGFNEMMAVSLSESRYYTEVFPGWINPEHLVYINNTSNVHLNIMRPGMLFSGLEAVLHNQNRQQSNIKLFEFGKSYQEPEKEQIEEVDHLSLLMTGSRWEENWINASKAIDYFSLKGIVEQILERVGLIGYQQSTLQSGMYLFSSKFHRGPQELVQFGKVHPSILKKMSIKGEVFYADFNFKALVKAAKRQSLTINELNKFPSSRRDLALVIEKSVNFGDIASIAKKIGKKLLKEVNLFDVYENEQQLGENKKSYAVSYIFEDPTKTLEDKQIDKVMSKLIATYEKDLNALIRR
ncbi:MAG: phenylalanine--tRNA ligase subunit beta [Bacteroidota bacterium]